MDFANDQIRVYIDGVGTTIAANFSSPFVAGGTDTHTDSIGANQMATGWDRFFDGLIDEVAVYNYALSEERILAHFAAAIPEPSSVAMVVVGAALLRRRRRSFNRTD